MLQPFVNKLKSFLDRQWVKESLRHGRYAKESEHNKPRQSNRFISEQGVFPRRFSSFVVSGMVVDCIYQDICIDKNHLPSPILRIIARSSSSKAYARALSPGKPGFMPMEKVC